MIQCLSDLYQYHLSKKWNIKNHSRQHVDNNTILLESLKTFGTNKILINTRRLQLKATWTLQNIIYQLFLYPNNVFTFNLTLQLLLLCSMVFKHANLLKAIFQILNSQNEKLNAIPALFQRHNKLYYAERAQKCKWDGFLLKIHRLTPTRVESFSASRAIHVKLI